MFKNSNEEVVCLRKRIYELEEEMRLVFHYLDVHKRTDAFLGFGLGWDSVQLVKNEKVAKKKNA